MRHSVHLNPYAEIHQLGNSASPGLLNVAVALDLAGVDGIVCRLNEDQVPVSVRDIRTLKEATTQHLAVEVIPKDDLVRQVMELNVDEIILIPGGEIFQGAGLDVIAEAGRLRDIIRSLHAANIDVGLLIRPEVGQVKEARKLEADSVVLNTHPYTQSRNAGEAIEQLEEIQSSALASNKLGMSTFVTGGLDHRTITPLASCGTVDEVILDAKLYHRALFKGLNAAFEEVREATRWHESRG